MAYSSSFYCVVGALFHVWNKNVECILEGNKKGERIRNLGVSVIERRASLRFQMKVMPF